ncbi:uncharacterized protein LOC126838476 isoform X2 [Adelges cooleyi]|uniref:uncharacterized protein LOC126838476 isoform X2 n=1 Tax=Adelges cooleyi TaxID=133065 RepID=UPI00217F8E17|nr:uncharacterized protein LOC126838476 isoform X2 [Adelges cooleyi]
MAIHDYRKTIDGLNEAGEIKIEIEKSDDYCFKSICEEDELVIERQKTNVNNKYMTRLLNTFLYTFIYILFFRFSESKIKIEDETDDYYGTVNKIDKDDEDTMKEEFTETFVKETKSTNIEKSCCSCCLTAHNDLSFDGNINNKELCNTTVVKVQVDIIDGHYYTNLRLKLKKMGFWICKDVRGLLTLNGKWPNTS